MAKDKLREYSEDSPDDWQIIQRKIDDTLNFRINWEDYKQGFGDVDRNFWFGLERLHQMTKDGEYELKMEALVTEDTGQQNIYYIGF